MGLCGLTAPEAYGGSGPDILAAVAAIEERCRARSFLAGPFIQCAFYGGMNIWKTVRLSRRLLGLPTHGGLL